MNMMAIIGLILGAGIGAGAGFLVWRLVGRRIPWRFGANVLVFAGAFAGALVVPDIIAGSGRSDSREAAAPIESATGQVRALDNPLLAALAARDHDFATRLTAQFPDGRAPRLAIEEYAITRGVEAALGYLPRAPASQLDQLITQLALATLALSRENPKACYGWLYGGYGYEAFDFAAFRDAIGDYLLRHQFMAYADLVISADGVEHPIPYGKSEAIGATAAANVQMIQVAGVENTGLVYGTRAPLAVNRDGDNDYFIACQARYVFYQGVLAEDNATDAIRHLFVQSAGGE